MFLIFWVIQLKPYKLETEYFGWVIYNLSVKQK